jgi:hypothetical protein
MQLVQGRFCLGDNCRIAFRVTQLDQLTRFVNFALDPPAAGNRVIEPSAFSQKFLGIRRVVPQAGIFGLRV